MNETQQPISRRMTVNDCINSPDYINSKYPLRVAFGCDKKEKPVVNNLKRLKNLFIFSPDAAQRNHSLDVFLKTVFVHTTPAETGLININLQASESAHLSQNPHALCPVITDGNQAVEILDWLNAEIRNRQAIKNKYKRYEKEPLNRLIKPIGASEELPENIVVVIHDLADLMKFNSRSVELGTVNALSRAHRLNIFLSLLAAISTMTL